MAATYTAADVSAIRAALVTVATRGAAEVEINGRRVKYTNLSELQALLEIVEASVNAESYGACMPVAFTRVDD
jgi:hypothetical protein